ncbi:hypothetical protein [Gimesia sp.]|uniref:hypothetical protein n=1 Tax=Gimesia sp. TaxID=2024833 RepID=UPI003A8FB75A
MFRRTQLLFSMVAFSCALLFALAALQPWYSAYVYAPIGDHNYLIIDNRSASWIVRIGDAGGIHGFDMGFKDTNPNLLTMRAKYVPFPVNWISDWYFQIRRSSPYFLMITPLYFPAWIFSAWPLCRIISRVRNRTRKKEKGAVLDMRESWLL